LPFNATPAAEQRPCDIQFRGTEDKVLLDGKE
jgi:hypothetical protein